MGLNPELEGPGMPSSQAKIWLYPAASLLAATGSLSEAGEQPGVRPAEYIETRCEFCHSRILSDVLLQQMMRTEGIASLGPFLARHHMPDEAVRELVIDYLGRFEPK